MRLACHRLRQKRLTRTGRSHQKRALWQSRADLGVFSGIVQEVYHFHQRFFCLILPGHILEGDARLLLHISLRRALAHAHRPAFAAHTPEKETQKSPHQKHRENIVQKHRHNHAGAVGDFLLHLHIVLQKPFRQLVIILHLTRVIGACAHAIRIEECRILLLRLRINRDAVRTHLHAFHLSVLHHLHKLIVRDFLIGSSRQHLHENTDTKESNQRRCYKHNQALLAGIPAASSGAARATAAVSGSTAVIKLIYVICHEASSLSFLCNNFIIR